MADALRDLGEPVNDMTLVLNLLRGLNGRFEAIGLHLRRGRPFPTFLQARNDLLLEELTMAESAPPPSATALTTTFGSAREPAPASVTPPAAAKPAAAVQGRQACAARQARQGRAQQLQQRLPQWQRRPAAAAVAQSSSAMDRIHQHVAWTSALDAATPARTSRWCTAGARWTAAASSGASAWRSARLGRQS